MSMTLIGFALCVGILAITGVAVLLDWRDRRRPTLPGRETCPVCHDDQVIHMDTHYRLAHRPPAFGPEDDPEWSEWSA